MLWRETVLLTPALWSFILVEFYDGVKSGALPSPHFLQLELERAKDVPLSISIQTQSSMVVDTYDHIDLISPYIPQCRTLVILDEDGSSDWAERLVGRRGHPHAYPFLRSLSWIERSRAGQTRWVDLSQAPLLQELTLQNVQPRRSLSMRVHHLH